MELFRKLVVYDEWSSITIHVALDNTLVVNDVCKYACRDELDTWKMVGYRVKAKNCHYSKTVSSRWSCDCRGRWRKAFENSKPMEAAIVVDTASTRTE